MAVLRLNVRRRRGNAQTFFRGNSYILAWDSASRGHIGATRVLSAGRHETRFSERNAYLNVRIPPGKQNALEETPEADSIPSGEARQRSKPRQRIPGPKGRAADSAMLERMRGVTARRVLSPGMKQFPVGHCHQQGYELIIPSTDLQWMGGKKP